MGNGLLIGVGYAHSRGVPGPRPRALTARSQVAPVLPPPRTHYDFVLSGGAGGWQDSDPHLVRQTGLTGTQPREAAAGCGGHHRLPGRGGRLLGGTPTQLVQAPTVVGKAAGAVP